MTCLDMLTHLALAGSVSGGLELVEPTPKVHIPRTSGNRTTDWQIYVPRQTDDGDGALASREELTTGPPVQNCAPKTSVNIR